MLYCIVAQEMYKEVEDYFKIREGLAGREFQLVEVEERFYNPPTIVFNSTSLALAQEELDRLTKEKRKRTQKYTDVDDIIYTICKI